jgi:arylsulfatase
MRNLVVVLSLLLCVAGFAAEEQRRPPNIIVILADDMGYSDLGCYGGEIETPNLNALAQSGVRFTQFYNTARCCPTRASLLTGLHPHQAGVGHMTADHGYDGYRGILNDRCVTMAEVLKGAGYRTYMAGKWHVTRNDNQDSDNSAWPVQRGFEKFYGTIKGGGSYYDPTSLCRQNTFITPENDPEYHPQPPYYYPNALSDNSIRFLQQHQQESPEKPFFLYLAFTAAHWPMHALESDLARYRGRYDGGYEPVRAARLERLKKLGLLPKNAELSPGAERWEDVKDKAWEARCMECYAAIVTAMDRGIGRLVAQLKEEGQLDNTLILFLQDNGGCAENVGRTANGPGPANLKPYGPNDLQPKVSPPMQTRDGRWVRTGPGVMPGPPDTFIAYGRGWANVSNSPFREYKHWTHEGGISTPLIAHWPKGIPRSRWGKLERQPGQLPDIMATLVDVSGATYPADYHSHKIQPMEGTSLRPAFSGKDVGRIKPLVWEHEANRAIREGEWKLVAKESAPWELYNIDSDRSELHDLAASQPDRVKSMAGEWDAWAARANVLPQGGWRGRGGEEPGSKDRRFVLKAGDRLARPEAPSIAGRAITITAKFDTRSASDGVLVAQGGSVSGFTLYLQGGKLAFTVRGGKGVATVTTPEAVSGEHTAVARLAADGTLSLSLDGGKMVSAPGGLISGMPVDGLQVGADEAGAVGPYRPPNRFSGTIHSVTIELE